MRRTLIRLTSYVCVCFIVFSCGTKDTRRSFSDIISYNDFIIERINEVDLCYARTLNNSETEKEGMLACDSLSKLCQETLDKLNHIQPFKGDSTFCEGAKKFTVYMAAISERELPQFFKLIFQENRDDAKQTLIDQRADFLDQHYESEMGHLNLIQKTLSTKFNYKITR